VFQGSIYRIDLALIIQESVVKGTGEQAGFLAMALVLTDFWFIDYLGGHWAVKTRAG